MTKYHKKLLVIVCAIICSLCLCFGITACNKTNGGGHTHVYLDGVCIECGAEDPDYEPNGGDGGNDTHDHFDEDEDELCDECGADLHVHKFSKDWTFNENRHWHIATCKHFIERSDYAYHNFVGGVCECGVKKSEVEVYALYKNSPEYDEEGMFFVEWLDWLKDNGIISVEYTESGDGIYHYEDRDEVHFVGERTVKVKAESGGEPLADVWFMVSLYIGSSYYSVGGTIALGIAKTDASGIAQITFSPVGGYSSSRIEYRIRVALSADIAIALGINEDEAKAIPNRYEVSSRGFEYVAYEVSENSSSEDIAATVNFTFSKGWNAYEQFTLPYARYYEKPYEGEGLKETGTTYEFTTSGENLFDYFYFTPSNRYSFASADGSFTPDQLAVIVENFQKAASGIYKIHFAVQGNANVTLYYWNEGGVNLGAYHVTNADGTPSDEYITSISGGTADEGKYTGGNFVNVKVTPANGLREFQFGIKSDAAVKIIFTVERVGDYVIEENDPITVGDNNNITLLGNGEITTLELQDVPAGYYYLTINTPDDVEKRSGLFSAYVDPSCVSSLWDGISQFKGIIEIPTGTPFLYICNYYSAEDEEFITVSVNLSVYEQPVVKLGEEISVPISGMGLGNGIEISLDESVTSGKYYFELTLAGGQALSGASWYVRVLVGDNDYSFSLPIGTSSSELISAYIDVNAGDKLSIFILSKGDGKYSSAIVSGMLKLTAFNTVALGEKVSTELYGSDNYYKEYTFVAFQAGTYKLTITQTNEPELYNSLFGYTTLAALEVTNATTSEIIKAGSAFSDTDPENFTLTATATFELQEGEDMILYFRSYHRNHLNFDFTIEYVAN